MPKVSCPIDGGLVLLDNDLLQFWKSLPPTSDFDPSVELSIAGDLRGVTDQAYQWPGEDWKDVWRRETEHLVNLVNERKVALLILHEGDFEVDTNLFDIDPAEETRELSTGLIITSGRLIVAELSKLVEDWDLNAPADYEDFSQVEIPAAPGEYAIRFLIPRHIESSVQGSRVCFGNQGRPCLYIRANRNAARPTPIKELLNLDFSSQ